MTPLRLHLDSGLGGSTLGFNLGAVGLLRSRALEGGLGCQLSAFLSTRVGCGLLAGVALDASQAWTVDVLAELGANQIHESGGFLSDDPGASGTVAYAGARVGARWYFRGAQRAGRASVGLWLFGERDLRGYEAHYSYTETSWLSGATSQQTTSRRLGDEFEVGLRLVVGFDVIL